MWYETEYIFPSTKEQMASLFCVQTALNIKA